MKYGIVRVAMGGVMAVALAGDALAQHVWIGDGSATEINNNGLPGWQGTGMPNAADAIADFTLLTNRVLTTSASPRMGAMIVNTFGAVEFGASGATPANLPFIFESTSGPARLILGGTNTARTASFQTGLTLNSNLLITWTNQPAHFDALWFRGVISGVGGIETFSWSAIRQAPNLTVRLEGANTFSGGVIVGTNTQVFIGHSMALGSGNVKLTNNTGTQLALATLHLTNNFRTADSSDFATFSQMRENGTVTLYGNITGTGRLRLGAGGLATNVTFILKGTVAPQAEIMATAVNATLQIDHASSMPAGGVEIRGRNAGVTGFGGTSTLRFMEGGTYTQRVFTAFGWSPIHHNYTVRVETGSSMTDKVTLNSSADFNFNTATGGLMLVAGHVGGTLEVRSRLWDGGSNRNVTVAGPGTVTINRASGTGNAWGGTTTVRSGTLLVNSILGGAGAVTIDVGATLGGTGLVTGATTVHGTLSPGTSTGVLDFGSDLTLAGTATTLMEIGGLTTGTQYDVVFGYGALTYGGALNLDIWSGAQIGNSFQLFRNFGTRSGTFASTNLVGGFAGAVAFDYNTGTLHVIPEPGTLGLIGTGLIAALLRRRFQKA